MGNFDPQLIVNVIVALLLVTTICFCWVVNLRLKALRINNGELRASIQAFSEAVDRAQNVIIRLKGGGEVLKKQMDGRAEEIIKDIDVKSARGRVLADELKILVESAESLANRLDGGIEKARKAAPPVANPLSSATATAASSTAARPTGAKPGVGRSRAAPAGDPLADDDGDWEEDSGMMDELSVRSEVERELLQTLRHNK